MFDNGIKTINFIYVFLMSIFVVYFYGENDEINFILQFKNNTILFKEIKTDLKNETIFKK